MIREALSKEEDGQSDDIGVKIMFLLAIATSIDALAVGISFSMDRVDVLMPAALIGVVTLLISAAGVKLGSVVGDRYSSKAEILGGVILILLGVKILLEHLLQ
jgi:putative Mn2+ efflux pump MntP